MLRKRVPLGLPLSYTLHIAVRKCNYRAELMALIVGRFAGSGVSYVPELPTGLWQASPETPQFHQARCGSIVGKCWSARQEKRERRAHTNPPPYIGNHVPRFFRASPKLAHNGKSQLPRRNDGC